MRLGAVRWLAPFAVLAAALVAHGESGRVVRVEIADLAFAPRDIRARVGDTIEWVSRDLFDHTATAPGDWDIEIPAGGRQSVVLRRAGAFDYICRYHPDMTGRIVVAAP